MSSPEAATIILPKTPMDIVNDLYNEGNKCMGDGRIEEAAKLYERAIEMQPGFVQAHYSLSLLKTYTADDPHLKLLESRINDVKDLPLDLHEKYWFTLGKMREDAGQYDAAFDAYEKGNRLVRPHVVWHDPGEDILLKNTMKAFTKEWFKDRGRAIETQESKGKTPIFVVGMPRSGTTLIEQILDTIPNVYGASELANMSEAMLRAIPNRDFATHFPSMVKDFTPEQFRQMGQFYLDETWKLSPNSEFIVDKMPANHFYVGFIYLMFPNAKIIHATRDPMDSCFSCYSKLFGTHNLPFSYDLGELSRFWVRYKKLMNHWTAVLPKDTIFTMPYEEMVGDIEFYARRLLEYIGVPWDARCLDFHKSRRHVKTTSMGQVTKPIYKSAVARWEKFSDHLEILFEAVKDYR